MLLITFVIILTSSHRMLAQEYYNGSDNKMSTALLEVETDANYTSMDNICQLLNKRKLCINDHLDGNVYIQAGVCITQFGPSNLAIVGLCPYFSKNVSWADAPLSNYYSFPARFSLAELSNFTCGAYNRQGLLCSQCKPGYGPAAYAFSLSCAECSSNSVVGWALYLFLVLFPITIFYFIVIIFNIRATAPPFTAFVLMCQTYCMVDLVYVPLKMKLTELKSLSFLLQTIRVLCGFWNLEYFRFSVPPFCVSRHLSTIQALSLEYVHIVYPLVLILVTFICIEVHARNFTLIVLLWKPFHRRITGTCLRRSLDPRASIINAFSSFLLLNFSKLVFCAGYCIWNTKPYIIDPTSISRNVHTSLLLYSDPTINLLSKQHLPYLLCSVIFLVVFFLIPTLLLCLYSTKIFRRLLQCCLSLRWQQAMGIFIDTFQGHYKDGTNGTCDYRAASGIYLVVIFLLNVINFSVYTRLLLADYVRPVLMAVSLFYALARPCKEDYANVIQSLLYALTAFIMLLISLANSHSHAVWHDIYLIMLLCLLTPHVVLGSYVVHKVTKRIGINCYSFVSM